MATTTVTRTIHAPAATVFDVVAHVENFRKAVPHIIGIEYASEARTGVGTRFKETRRMGKREATVELEVTEYEPNERVRLVSDTHGTVWDTVFSIRPTGDGPNDAVELTMAMDARAHKLLAKIMNPLIRGMIRKAIEKDMDAVKAHCEQLASASG